MGGGGYFVPHTDQLNGIERENSAQKEQNDSPDKSGKPTESLVVRLSGCQVVLFSLAP